MDIHSFLQKIDLVTLVERSTHAQLRRNGKGYHCPCPIHHGDNPGAFTLYQDQDNIWRWHCFTRCNAGGDAISFVQAIRGLDFKDALIDLAQFAGIPLEQLQLTPADAKAETLKRSLQAIHGEATRFYASHLWGPEGAAALAYLRERGFTDETIKASRFGYSDSSSALRDHLTAQAVDLAAARTAGLIRADGMDFTANAEGRTAAPYGWVVYPHITNEHVTYFSTRAIEADQPRPNPKDKSRNLPGKSHFYRCEIPGQWEHVVIVEGPADARALWQIGQPAWALCGLKSETCDPSELATLKRRQSIYLAPDSDEAGLTSLSRLDGKLVKLANTLGPLTWLLPTLEAGKDFAALLKEHILTAEHIAELRQRATSWLEYRMRLAADAPAHELDGRMTEIGKLMAAIPETTRPRYVQQAQKILGLSKREVYELVSLATGKSSSMVSSIKDGCLCFLGRPVGNFSAAITHELMVDDGQSAPLVKYSINGKLAAGQPLETVEIPAEEFSGLKWVPRHWGARPVLFGGQGQYHEIARAIQEISMENIKRERVYTYTGWTTIEGQRSYLTGTGRLTADGLNPETRVELGVNNLRYYQLPAPPENEILFQSCQASINFLKLSKRTITAPLWAAMYAAPLTAISPLYAVLWVYGQTQSGKSTIAHLALCHFGQSFIDGRQYHAPIDWTSTATALEGAMFSTKDTPLVIDDFAPQFTSASESRDMHKKAHYVVRSVGNRSSRGRSQANLIERTTRVPRGLVIATAENPLLGQSIVGRMLYIPVDRGDLFEKDNTPLDAAQQAAQSGAYARAMAAYLQYMINHWQRYEETLPDLIEAASSGVRRDHPDLQNRLPDYYALLHAASLLALRAYQDLGVISGFEAQQLAEDNRLALLTLITQQAERISAESPVKKFIEAINTNLEQGKVYLAPCNKDVEYLPPARADLIGWFDPRDPSTVYLMTETCLQVAKDFWRELDENLDVLPDALRRQVAQAGILAATDDKGQHVEVVKWISGKSRRCLAVSNQQLSMLYGIQLANEPQKSGATVPAYDDDAPAF